MFKGIYYIFYGVFLLSILVACAMLFKLAVYNDLGSFFSFKEIRASVSAVNENQANDNLAISYSYEAKNQIYNAYFYYSMKGVHAKIPNFPEAGLLIAYNESFPGIHYIVNIKNSVSRWIEFVGFSFLSGVCFLIVKKFKQRVLR
jgi:hypothetical protein